MINKYLFVGGRNLAGEFRKSGCQVSYITASDFLSIKDDNIFSDLITVLAHSNVLSEEKYGIKQIIPMNKITDKFISMDAMHKIILSSASVYGLRSSTRALNEKSRLLGFSKYALEKKNMEYQVRATKNLKKNLTIFRVSSILCSDITVSRNIFSKLEQLKKGLSEGLSVEHEGTQLRDFCTINTLISTINKCCGRHGSLTYNLADIEAIKIKSLVEMFLTKNGKNRVRYEADGATKIHCYLDISLAAKHFGVAKFPLSQLLKNF